MAKKSIGVLTPTSTSIEIRECSDTFETAKEIVNGYIERVLLTRDKKGNRFFIYLNEEGKILGLEPTAIGNYVDSDGIFLGRDFLMGNLVIVKESKHGNSMLITPDDVKLINSFMGVQPTQKQPNGTDFLLTFTLVN